jgi:hypothetical protein
MEELGMNCRSNSIGEYREALIHLAFDRGHTMVYKTPSTELLEIVEDYKDLIYEFFVTFCRFEYALKEAGFFTYVGRWDYISPDWRNFSEAIEENFEPNDEKIREAFNYLDKNPPMIQTLDENEGKIIWRPNTKSQNQTDSEWCLWLVKTVRNNLFHGSKFPFDPERDTKLLSASLDILAYCVDLDNNIKEKFLRIAPKNY